MKICLYSVFIMSKSSRRSSLRSSVICPNSIEICNSFSQKNKGSVISSKVVQKSNNFKDGTNFREEVWHHVIELEPEVENIEVIKKVKKISEKLRTKYKSLKQVSIPSFDLNIIFIFDIAFLSFLFFVTYSVEISCTP